MRVFVKFTISNRIQSLPPQLKSTQIIQVFPESFLLKLPAVRALKIDGSIDALVTTRFPLSAESARCVAEAVKSFQEIKASSLLARKS